ncbi:hypothetical protein MADA3029_720052 [Vibrio nigripulchritudo MADA3029]|nr:hypothetical protein VIBNIMADA3020_490051 [Vibrio nigripulchritudo MADA3020]CCN61148.1 hypothetical protein MADA3029_720052 [Vibrio nigripulchritudo MADA3029]
MQHLNFIWNRINGRRQKACSHRANQHQKHFQQKKQLHT